MLRTFFLFSILIFLPFYSHAQHVSSPPQDLSIEKNWPPIHSLITKDSRTIIINIWASWCIPCKKELPVLNKLDKNKWQLVTVNVDNNTQDALNFLTQNNLSSLAHVTYHDPKLELMRSLNIQALPATIVADSSGKPISLIQGDISYNPIPFLSHNPASD